MSPALLLALAVAAGDLRGAPSMTAATLLDASPWVGGLRVERDELIETGPYSLVFLGHVVGDEGSSVVLSAVDGVVAGSVLTSERRFHLRDGRVQDVSATSEAPERLPLSANAATGPSGPSTRVPGWSVSGDRGDRLDLLVVYTPRARASAGGRRSMEALVQLGVAELNHALEQSLVPTRVRLVEAREVSYQEAGRAESDLEILAGHDDGALDEVHELRDTFGADFVQLVVEEGDGCGIAYQMQGESTGFAEWAFSVVERACIDRSYAIAHELGHNFGCDHAPEDPISLRGAFTFSYGYKDFAQGLRTLMAYGPGRRLPRFSSPRISFDGRPLGGPLQDNALSVTKLRRTLAGFRPEILPPELSPPPGSALGSEVRFRLSALTPVLEWWLIIGTMPGARDVFDSGSIVAADSVRVSDIPDDLPLHVRLFYRRGNVWLYENFTY